MKCPRCGGNMSSGVCEDCGFPEVGKMKYKMIKYVNVKRISMKRKV